MVVFLLQRAKDANRVYATFVHGKTNSDGFKEQGITFPSATAQKELYTEFYKEIQISPLDVEYIEAHGTATKVGDPEELNALDAVFCTGRDAPLKIGSVKSNMGHAETASGVGSVSKVLFIDNDKKETSGLILIKSHLYDVLANQNAIILRLL